MTSSAGLAMAMAVMFGSVAMPVYAQDDDPRQICPALEGAKIVTEEGKYLGKLASRYDSDSVFNKYGSFGSRYSADSIWNKYGSYGGAYSAESPFNKYSSNPPLVVKDRDIIGRLTVNKNAQGAVNPTLVGIICFDYEPQD
jgi:hypothetical protein